VLTKDELSDGTTFILKLCDANEKPFYWLETLRGDTARHWYDIYNYSNWEALRLEAADTFHRAVSEDEAQATRRSHMRCIFVHTRLIKADELAAGRGSK